MEERVYKTTIHDRSDLKQRLIVTWASACEKAKGHHFEYLLN